MIISAIKIPICIIIMNKEYANIFLTWCILSSMLNILRSSDHCICLDDNVSNMREYFDECFVFEQNYGDFLSDCRNDGYRYVWTANKRGFTDIRCRCASPLKFLEAIDQRLAYFIRRASCFFSMACFLTIFHIIILFLHIIIMRFTDSVPLLIIHLILKNSFNIYNSDFLHLTADIFLFATCTVSKQTVEHAAIFIFQSNIFHRLKKAPLFCGLFGIDQNTPQ